MAKLQEKPAAVAPRAAAMSSRKRHWLLLVHQLPSTPSNLRVRTWRRLQQLGALAIKQAVYVLPDSPSAREDFEWLKTEISAAGGQATVFTADSIDSWSDDELVTEFRRSRQEQYAALAREVEHGLRPLANGRAPRRGRSVAHRSLALFQQRLAAIDAVDFFGSAGRDRVITLLDQLKRRIEGGAPQARPTRPAAPDREAFRGRVWVTRPRPGIDRIASAWLIKRFIDPAARFGFVEDKLAAAKDAIPFDMFGVELSHQGDRCTFETLCHTFTISDAAVDRLAAIVHDLDLKDARFRALDAPTVGAVVEGLQMLYPDDDVLLAQGTVVFEALYRAFEQAARRTGPRPVAITRAAPRGARRRRP